MADQELREVFSDCIDRMAAGQSIGDCLRRYPQYAARLQPMLETGSLIERTQASHYEIAPAQARVRARVIARMHERPRQRSYGRWGTLAASLLLAFAVLFGAAENSLPGDPLYNVKRFTEGVRSTLIGQEFAARRLDEIRALEALKRPADTEFSGLVEQIAGLRWRIAGLDVQVTTETIGVGSVRVGDTVRVTAHVTAQGDLVASQIARQNPVVAPLAVTETITPIATPTIVFTPTPTPLPTSTPTPTTEACTPTLPAGWVRYVVQSGDTVSGLAAATGASVDQLLTVNCLPLNRMIIVGQTLFLPVLPVAAATTPAPATPTPDMAGGDEQATPLPTGQDTSGEDHGSEQRSEADG